MIIMLTVKYKSFMLNSTSLYIEETIIIYEYYIYNCDS